MFLSEPWSFRNMTKLQLVTLSLRREIKLNEKKLKSRNCDTETMDRRAAIVRRAHARNDNYEN